MAIHERIRFHRNLRGITQKCLGMSIGLTEKTADVRMAQYESGARTPKKNMIADLANVLGVCPQALDLPDIDSYTGLMHTLFALEDVYGLKIGETDGEVCLRLDKSTGRTYEKMIKMLSAWQQKAAKLEAGEISKEEYNQWCYRFPKFNTAKEGW